VNSKLKTLLFWLALVAVFVWLYQTNRGGASRPVPFRVFEAEVKQGTVRSVEVDGNRIRFRLTGSNRLETVGSLSAELTDELERSGIEPRFRSWEGYDSLIYYVVVGIVLVVALLFFLKRVGSGGAGNILALGKSRAKLVGDGSKITFADVGGCHEAKELFGDVIDFLKAPQRWTRAGVRLPRGVLLEGPPGSGKTHLVRAVAGETGAKFYVVAASEFVELFVGVGASRVRDMFETAAKNAPTVIFIDEIDAIGRRRGSGLGGSHDEREQTLNQLLICLDGFQQNARVVVIAATNRPDILDQALLRPGRFDRRIKMPELSRADRVEILKIHTHKKPLGSDVSLDEVAGWTDGRHGADLESLANEAGLLAVRRSRRDTSEPAVCREDFRQALRPRDEQNRLFDRLDAVLIESTSQLAEPTGRAVVRLLLRDHSTLEGDVVWVDATYIKVRTRDGDAGILVPKAQVLRLEAVSGTEAMSRDDVVGDQWAGRRADLA
jgi:cell division protease FtsH